MQPPTNQPGPNGPYRPYDRPISPNGPQPQPAGPYDQQLGPYDRSQPPYEQSQGPYDQPLGPYDRSLGPAEQPSGPYDRSQGSYAQPLGPYDPAAYRGAADRAGQQPSQPPDPVELRRVAPAQSAGMRTHRRRRRKGGAGRIGAAGAVAGILGIAAVTVLIVIFRHGGSTPVSQLDSAQPGSSLQQLATPKTGPVLSLATPDGFAYGVGAIKAGTTTQPLTKGGTPAPAGGAFAYADYVFTNTGSAPALLDFTAADLFVKRSQVPDAAQARCMPQPGTPDDMCTLPNSAAIIGAVNGSKPPTSQNGDQYMPPGAAYVIRVQTSFPVNPNTTQADLNVYVWQARFIANRKAVLAAFPQ